MKCKAKQQRNVTNGPKVELATRLLKLALNRSALEHESRDAMLQFYTQARDNLIDFEELVAHAQKSRKEESKLQPKAADPGANEAEDAEDALKAAGNTPLPFGKYEGYPVSAVLRFDRAYLHFFLSRHSEDEPELCSRICTFLKGRL